LRVSAIAFPWLVVLQSAKRTTVAPPVHATIESVALHQATEVPLASVEHPVGERTVPVIAGKPGAVRVVVSGATEAVRATLDIVGSTSGTASIDAHVRDRHAFVFRLDGDAVAPDTSLVVRLADASGKEIDRWPASGAHWLDARSLGTLELAIVKVAYEGDSSGRVPDTSEARMTRWASHLLRQYPFASVHLTVLEEPLVFAGDLRKPKAWSELLVSLAHYRDAHALAPDALVYGIVNPARGFGTFHGTMAGLGSYPENGEYFRVAAGLGFTMDDDTTFAEVMAHELGHNLGLPHAPCNADGQVDPAYPYAGGRIGARGYDAIRNVWYDPMAYDTMTYCDPSWVSDWAFVRLFRGSRGAFDRAGASSEPNHVAAYDLGVQVRGFAKDGAGKPLANASVCLVGSNTCGTSDATGAWVLMSPDDWRNERLAFERPGKPPTLLSLVRPRPFDVYVESTDLWSLVEAEQWAAATGADLSTDGLVRVDVHDMAADSSAPGAVGAKIVSAAPVVYAGARGEPDRSLTAIGARGRAVLSAAPGPLHFQVEGFVCPVGQMLAPPGDVDVVAGTVAEVTLYCARAPAQHK
jgi:hypothetical protein